MKRPWWAALAAAAALAIVEVAEAGERLESSTRFFAMWEGRRTEMPFNARTEVRYFNAAGHEIAAETETGDYSKEFGGGEPCPARDQRCHAQWWRWWSKAAADVATATVVLGTCRFDRLPVRKRYVPFSVLGLIPLPHAFTNPFHRYFRLEIDLAFDRHPKDCLRKAIQGDRGG
jgi:hypothetical protein